MKKFWYKFLVVVLAIGMLVPTWLTIDTQKAKAASAEIIVNNTDPEFSKTGTPWVLNSNASGIGGSFYVEQDDSNLADPVRTAKWQPDIAEPGLYQVYVHWSARDNRGTNVSYKVAYSGGTDTTIIDQTKKADGSDAGGTAVASGWKLLGSYYFVTGTSGNVELTESAIGRTTADAVKFVHNNELPSVPILQTPENNKTTNQTSIGFSWLASTDVDDTALTYDFQLNKNSVLENEQTGLTSTNLSIPSLTDGNFAWRTRGFDGESYSLWSEYFSFIIDTTVPTAPTNLVATIGNGEVSLNWDAVTGADHYNVYYKKVADAVFSNPVPAYTNFTKIIGLENGIKYNFIVRAVGASGNVSADAWIDATPIAPKVVLASAPVVAVTQITQPETPSQTVTPSTPTVTTPIEQGKIKGEEDTTSEETENINWTPWIILFILIILAGAATGGYFYWFGREEEEEIITKEIVEKKSATKKTPKTASKKSKRW